MYMANNGNSRNGSWEARLGKGCLEMAILATVWDNRKYGLELLRVLSAQSADIAEGLFI